MGTQLREWKVLSMLEWGTQYFKQKGIPDPRLSIEWLLAEVLKVKRLDLYLKFDRPLSPDELDRIRPLVKRRASHEPLQYIIGFTEFMNVRIDVSPDVLIPRIETEQLVEIVLENHSASESLSLLDIGTGSGCIPVALKKECPAWDITGLDISAPALDLARKNAKLNDVDISLMHGDILRWEEFKFSESFDLIVSNPPYILSEEKEQLEPQVAAHEPSLALFCDNVENMYGKIMDFSERRLKPEGVLYLEVHELHAQKIAGLFTPPDWEATLKKDYEKKPRFVEAHRL